MITFAYDAITRHDDGARIDLRPNCQFRSATGELRCNSSTLVTIYVLERQRLRCVATDDALRTGAPFVYPIEFQFNMPVSLAEDPDPAPGIGAAVLQAVRAGRAVVLFWVGHEHVPPALEIAGKPSSFDSVLEFVRRHELPPGQVWFVSGDVNSGYWFADWLRKRGLYEAEAFRFVALSVSPATVRMQYRANERGEDVSHTRDGDLVSATLSALSAEDFAERYMQPAEIAEERRSGRVRPKRFLSMNRTSRLHRQMILSYLQGRGLIDGSLVSCSKQFPSELDDSGVDPSLQRLLRESWRALYPKLPLVLDEFFYNSGLDVHKVASGWPYRSTYFNITTETDVSPMVGPVITEKLVKPMLNFQPFLAVTSADTLRYLHAIGFKTFPAIIDEGYDAVRDPAERITRIFAQIDRLGKISQGEARDRYFACMPELEHNLAHAIEGRFEFDDLLDALEAQLG